jgi:hypothetical protein
MTAANTYQVDVADRLGLRPEPEQIGDHPTVLPHDPRRVTELVHEHRVMHSTRPVAAPEVLEVCEDVQEVLVGTPVDFHGEPS